MTNYKRVQLITTLFCIAATAQTTTSTGVVFVSSPYYAYFLPRNNYTGTVGFALSMSTSGEPAITLNSLRLQYLRLPRQTPGATSGLISSHQFFFLPACCIC